MANRRSSLANFYTNPRSFRGTVLEKAAVTSDRYQFKGAAVKFTVVVRVDINGYSRWAKDKGISERVELLDDFFSYVIPLLEEKGGVFFRDEGDCIVGLFSDYFQTGATFESLEKFCLLAGSRLFGKPQLSAKSVIVCGDVAYFQKVHEIGTEDWSAEGHAFVAAARLEAAVDSKQQINIFKTDYDAYFRSTNVNSSGTTARWVVEECKRQVVGLGFEGGWTDLVVLNYVE